MELRSLTQARITTGVDRPRGWTLRGRRARVGESQQVVLSVFGNVFFAYAASEVRVGLTGGMSGDELCRCADEVLLAAGWGTGAWSSPGPGRWEAPAFDLSDPDVPVFLEQALVGGKLYLTRHAEKIGRYLEHVGGPDLIERFSAGIAREHPAMAATLDRVWHQ